MTKDECNAADGRLSTASFKEGGVSAEKTARTCHCEAEGPLHPTHEAPECESFEKLERGATKAGCCEERSDAAIPLIPHELWSREIATSSTSGGLLATSRLQEQGDRNGKASRPAGLPRQGLAISDRAPATCERAA